MTLKELRIFVTICETRSISRAAARLDMTQPGVSRTLRDLEKRYQLRFFDRNGRGVEPTEAGRILREKAEGVLAAVDEIDATLEELRGEIDGTVVVLLPTHVSQAVTPILVRRFAETFPRGTIHVFEDANARIPERVLAGEADFGIHYASDPALATRETLIATEPLYLVELAEAGGMPPPPGWLQTAQSGQIAGSAPNFATPAPFATLRGMDLVLPRRVAPYRQFIETEAQRANVHLNVVRELEMGSTLLAFVLEREGATILPFSHCHVEVRQGLVTARKLVEPAIQRWIKLVRSSIRPNRSVRAAMELLLAAVEAENALLGWQFPR